MKKTITVFCLSAVTLTSFASPVDSILSTNQSRVERSKASQKRIDAIHDRTDSVFSAYQAEAKVVKSLKIHNKRQERVIEAQKVAVEEYKYKIENVGQVERQIIPLMLQMLSAMDKFIELDLPFRKEQRVASQNRLESYMSNVKIAASERFRLVFDAYSREVRNGKSIESYKDTIKFLERDLDVDILRVGRVALYFQTTDEKISGIWDESIKDWKRVDNKYNSTIRRAIGISQKKVSPDLLKDLPFLVGSYE